ncbi:hypothetical protein ACP4OV_018912 [Aristida adscensionis]
MSSSEHHQNRCAFTDVTNTSSTGIATVGTHILDAKERKKQRDRERYARNKEEILRKRREKYHEKKAKLNLAKDCNVEGAQLPVVDSGSIGKENLNPLAVVDCNVNGAQLPEVVDSGSIGKEDLNPLDTNDWLHRNDAYDRPQVVGQIDVTPISMSVYDVNAIKILNTSSPVEKLTADHLAKVGGGNTGKENMNDVYVRPQVGQRSILTADRGEVSPISMVDDNVNASKIVNTSCLIGELSGELMPFPLVDDNVNESCVKMPTSKLGGFIPDTEIINKECSTSQCIGKKHPRDVPVVHEEVDVSTPDNAILKDSQELDAMSVPIPKSSCTSPNKSNAKRARWREEQKQAKREHQKDT